MTVCLVDCCSVTSNETSISSSLFVGFGRARKTDNAAEKMTTLGCKASFLSRSIEVHLLQTYSLYRTFLLEWFGGWLFHC